MNIHAAINRADRLCAETGRTHFVIGNGLGQYAVVDRLPTLPAGIPAGAAGAGSQTVRPDYMASPPHVVGTDAPTPENDPAGRFRDPQFYSRRKPEDTNR